MPGPRPTWLVLLTVLLMGLTLAGLARPGSAELARASEPARSAPAGVCPVVAGTPALTYAYGAVTLDGAPAAPDTVIEAVNPRGDVVGCFVVLATSPGNYGSMPIYGEDTSVTPAIPGMRVTETVTFRVNGAVAVAAPALVWQNDKDVHPIALSASSPTPTPTPTSTPTAANQPDLIVKSMLVAPAAPAVGQAFTVTVHIKNQGTGAVTQSFFTDVYTDHIPVGCDDFGWAAAPTAMLGPGEVASLSFTADAGFSTTGAHTLRAYVDSSCRIAEADETNNVGLLRVTVLATATPPPTPLPPVAPVIAMGRGTNNSAVLTWTHADQNVAYQVWRGRAPYFPVQTPDASVIADGGPPDCTTTGDTITCNDAASMIGNPTINYFYVIRALNAANVTTDSNRVGEFDFALQPGSP